MGATMGTAVLIAKHRVADFGAFRTVYDTVGGLRQQHGCTSDHVLQDPSDEREVFVVHRFPTLAQAQAFAASPELKDAMGRAGVAGPPRIEIAVEA